MNRQLLAVFLCALVGAGSTGYLAWRAFGARASSPAPMPAADVVVATRSLQAGSLITGPDIKLAKWPGGIPKGALTRLDLALNRGVVAPISEGEFVFADRLAAPGFGAGLSTLIPPGMRACAVKVDEVVSVSGFVTPGMRVDVLVTGSAPGESGGPRVKTLLQNIQVLSAGANLQKDTEGKPQTAQVVNLLVTPEQAETLSLAGNQTRIQLVLRNPGDTVAVRPPGAAMSDLFGVPTAPNMPAPRVSVRPAPEPKPEPEIKAAAARRVEVLNGTVRTEARFEAPEASR